MKFFIRPFRHLHRKGRAHIIRRPYLLPIFGLLLGVLIVAAVFHYRGGTETFIARSAEPLDKGQPVIVVQTLGPRTVIVLPWADPVENLLEL